MARWHRSKAAPFGVSSMALHEGTEFVKGQVKRHEFRHATRLCASATCRSSTSNLSTARRFQSASASRRPPLSVPPSAMRSSPPWELGCATCPCVRPRCARRSRVAAERNDVRWATAALRLPASSQSRRNTRATHWSELRNPDCRNRVILCGDRDVEALRASRFALARRLRRNPSIGHGCAPHQFAASRCLRIPRIRP